MLTIKVLGPGCANCRKLEEVARTAVASAGVEAEVVKVSDMQQIVGYGVLKTPGSIRQESAAESRQRFAFRQPRCDRAPKDATAAAILPEGDGYLAALTDFRFTLKPAARNVG